MKIVRGSKDKEVKSITYKLYEEEGDNELVVLTPRMRSVLLASVEMISWKKRHEVIPSDLSSTDDFQAWIDALRYNLMNPLDFCQLMIDNASCFLSDEGVSGALNSQIENAIEANDTIQDIMETIENVGGAPMSVSELNRNIILCISRNSIGAQCIFLVDYLNASNLDFFEIFETGTNAQERAALIIGSIPALGEWYSQLLQYVDKLEEEIVENYNGQYTTTGENNYRDTLICELFCRMLEDCEFSLDKAIVLFQQRLGAAVADSFTIPALFTYFLGGTFAGTLIVDFAMYNQVVFLKNLNQFGRQIGLSYLDGRLQDASENPTDILEDICTDCGERPNILFSGTYYPLYDGTPKTFMGNTETGGSIWEITCQDISGVSAAAIGMFLSDGVSETCVRITHAEGVTSYQHDRDCDGLSQESGGGAGNPATSYGPNLGFYGTGIITVTFEIA